jgi:hypothetical protein
VNTKNFFTKAIKFLYLSLFFFPWVRFGWGGDLQPLAALIGLLVAAAVLVKRNLIVPNYIVLLLMLGLVATVVVLFDGRYSILSFRALVTYWSLPIHALCILYYASNTDLGKIVRIVSMIYMVAGLMQYFLGSDLLSFFVQSRTSISRGVPSLTPEPSSFGFYALALLSVEVYFYRTTNSIKRTSFWPNLVSIFILSMSAITIAYVFIFALVLIVRVRYKVRYIVYVLAFLPFSIKILESIFQGSRALNLAERALSSGVYNLLSSDPSVNDRLRSVVFAFNGAYENYLMPGGMHSFGAMSKFLRLEWDGFFYYGADVNRLMSGIGTLVYELGIFSVILLIAVWMSVRTLSLKDRGTFIGLYLIFFLAPNTLAIPIAGGILSMFRDRTND